MELGDASEEVGGQRREQIVVERQPQQVRQSGETVRVDLAQVVGQQEELLHTCQSGEGAAL